MTSSVHQNDGNNGVVRINFEMEYDEGIGSDDLPTSASSSASNNADSDNEVPKEDKSPKSINNNTEKHNISKFLRSIGLNRGQSNHLKSGHISDMSSAGRVFGKELHTLLKETDSEVPTVVRICAECIEKHGMVDGIYRLSGISSNIRALKMSFEQCSEEESYTILNPSDPDIRQDIHSISSLLKLFCRELPNPLCTFKLYERFMRAAKAPDEFRLGALREIVMDLPKDYFNTLSFLMKHLFCVSKKGDETGMTAKNLAIVWAPNLLRSYGDYSALQPSSPYKQMSPPCGGNLEDIALQAACTECLIKYCDVVFSKELPLGSSGLEEIGSFELGFSLGEENSKEIDIDNAIAKASESANSSRPKSIAISNPVDLQHFKPRRKLDFDTSEPKSLQFEAKIHTVVNLERSKSSVAMGPNGLGNKRSGLKSSFSASSANFLQLLQFKNFLNQRSPKVSFSDSKNYKTPRQTSTNDTDAANNREGIRKRLSKPYRLMHSASVLSVSDTKPSIKDKAITEETPSVPTRQKHLRSVKSSECLRERRTTERARLTDILSPAKEDFTSSSKPALSKHNGCSKESEDHRDIIDEVNDLQLSFESEEREISMMDTGDFMDDSNNTSFSSSNSSQVSSSPDDKMANNLFASSDKEPEGESDSRPKNSPKVPEEEAEEERKSGKRSQSRLKERMKRLTSPGSNSNVTAANPEVNNNTKSKIGSSLRSKVASVLRRKSTSETLIMRKDKDNNNRNVYNCQMKQKSYAREAPRRDNFVDVDEVRGRVLQEMKQISLPRAKLSPKGKKDINSKDNSSFVQEMDKVWHKKRSEMDTIQEEMLLNPPSKFIAFDNQAYGLGSNEVMRNHHQADSGFESNCSYENVLDKQHLHSLGYQNVIKINPVYENDDCDSFDGAKDGASDQDESYENVSLPEEKQEYQNVPKLPEKKRKKLFKTEITASHQPQSLPCSSVYQNFDFDSFSKPSKPSQGKQPKKPSRTKKVSRQVDREDSSAAIYENYEFGEETIYQNVVFKRGKVVPALKASKERSAKPRTADILFFRSLEIPERAHKPDDEVYAQVKFLRKTVEEVNSLLEKESRKNLRTKRSKSHSEESRHMLNSEPTSLIVPRPPSSSTATKNKNSSYRPRHSENLVEDRKAHFKALLSRFDGQQQSEKDHYKPEALPERSKTSSRYNKKLSLPTTSGISIEDRKQRFSVN